MSEPKILDELPSDVVDAMRRDRKTEAIRLLQERHGFSPGDARRAADAYAAHHTAEKGLVEPGQGAGIGWIITVVVIIAVLYALYTYVE